MVMVSDPATSFSVAPRESDVEIIPPSQALTQKALVPGDERAVLSLVVRAEQALEHLTKDFGAWMGVESDRLLGARHRYAAAPDDSGSREELYRAVHDIRANGAGFGYPVASRIAANLARLLEEVANVPEVMISRHVAAIRAVVREDARGTENRSAIALAEELERIGRSLVGPQSRRPG